jgi:predicted metalloendopeptidase
MQTRYRGFSDHKLIPHWSWVIRQLNTGLLVVVAMPAFGRPVASLGPEPPVPSFSTGYLDRSVSPRTNFYLFATGQWVKDNPVPSNEAVWSSAVEMDRVNSYKIHVLLEEAAASHARKGTSRQEVGDFYRSAMNTNRLERLGFKPIAADLERIDRIASLDDLSRELARFHREDVLPMFEVSAKPDFKKRSIYALKLEQGGLSLPSCDYYVKESFAQERKGFREHIAKMFALLGEGPDAAQLHASVVMDLETALAKSSVVPRETHNKSTNYNKFTRIELAGAYPGITWQTYLSGLNLADVPYVVVGQPHFFKALDGLLRDRPLADWRIYLRWHLLHDSARYLCRSAEAENFDFFGRTLADVPEQRPRWRRAFATMDASIGDALGRLYVERYFPLLAKARVSDLVDDLRAAFVARLQQVAWMKQGTREKAIAKFNHFVLDVGCPETLSDYSSLEIKPDDYLGNVRRANALSMQRELALVGDVVDRADWDMNPQTINAEFARLQNAMHLPAGILQPPFFDMTKDDAVNYAAIGTVIAHEITHGYGMGLDEAEDSSDWPWTEAQIDEKAYETNMQKIVDQYAEFEVLPGLRVDGMMTCQENVADIGSVRIAFDALQRALTRDPSKRKTIDGFAPEQRFFISFAQICRTNIRETAARRLAADDGHAPARFRAVAPLQNFQEFFDAFDIRSGDPMWRAPELRAQIW